MTLDKEGFIREILAVFRTMAELGPEAEWHDTDSKLLWDAEYRKYAATLYDHLESHGYYVGRTGYDKGGIKL